MYFNKNKINDEALIFDSNDIFFEKTSHQRVSQTNSYPLLVLYSIPLDHQNNRTPVEVANDIFGICEGCTPDPINLKSQYMGCSGGKVNIVAACSQPTDSCFGNPEIRNGVLEVPIAINVHGRSSRAVASYDHMEAFYILQEYGINLWDFYILHVIPDEANWGSGSAWAYIPGKISAIKDSKSNVMGIQAHEFGHNLGMQHSGEGINQYNDHSCLMGDPSYGDDGARICFNGAKSWDFGWYMDDSLTVNVLSNQNFDGLLLGVDDYVNGRHVSGLHHVVIKVIDPSKAEDYYIMFNRKKGVNDGVTFAADMVTVTTSQKSEISWNQGNLDASENSNEFTIENFGNSERRLVVKVCYIRYANNEQLPDTARVLVYMDNDLSCETVETSAPTVAQTDIPTITPTISPTATPTSSPTFQPSKSPTLTPTKSPTVSPTLLPTKFPCGDGESYYSVKVRTDDKAVEDRTTFRVLKLLAGPTSNREQREHLFAKRIYSLTQKNFEWGRCLDVNFCYRFTARDFGNDGICCEHGEGSYEISFNGK